MFIQVLSENPGIDFQELYRFVSEVERNMAEDTFSKGK